MGAPLLLGGAVFQISRVELSRASLGFTNLQLGQSGSGFEGRRGAYRVASAVAANLRTHSYEVTEPKRGKIDDVKLQCSFGKSYISVILRSEGDSRETFAFSLDASGFRDVNSADARARVSEDLARHWERLVTLMDSVLRDQFRAEPLVWLSGDEIDARDQAKERQH